jgi:hypothetical protein
MALINTSTLPSNTPLKPIRDTDAYDIVLDCTLKYKHKIIIHPNYHGGVGSGD